MAGLLRCSRQKDLTGLKGGRVEREAVPNEQTFEGWRTGGGGLCDQRLREETLSIDKNVVVAALLRVQFTREQGMRGWINTVKGNALNDDCLGRPRSRC